jgi:hypothetical protein
VQIFVHSWNIFSHEFLVIYFDDSLSNTSLQFDTRATQTHHFFNLKNLNPYLLWVATRESTIGFADFLSRLALNL